MEEPLFSTIMKWAAVLVWILNLLLIIYDVYLSFAEEE